jgi:hypothetical protein
MDTDLRLNTRVDVLPIVCKQGVRGSSPLAPPKRTHTDGTSTYERQHGQGVNGQVAVPAGGQVKVPTPRVG